MIKLFPQSKRKIANASAEDNNNTYTERPLGDSDQKLFLHNDHNEQNSFGIDSKGKMEQLVEFFETYEKIKVSYINLFYRVPPDKEQLKQIKKQSDVAVMEMQKEMQVEFLEQQNQMQEAVNKGEMLPERYQLEIEKAQTMMQEQLKAYQQEIISKLQAEASKIENKVLKVME